MRVLQVAEAFGGGVLEVVRTLSHGLSDLGHDVGIAYGRRPETPAEPRSEVDPQVDLFPLPWTRRTPLAQVRATRELRNVIGEWEPDVVHLHSAFAGVVGMLAVPRALPTVYSPHAYSFTMKSEAPRPGRWLLRQAERLASRSATVLGAVSQSEARLARAAGARHVEVVENGIPELDDPPAVGGRPDEGGCPRVVAMGRTVPQRCPEECARILSAVGDVADVEWIGGGGGDRGTAGFRALVDAGITPTGWLPRGEVLERLGAATAYLHWTAWDAHPLSVLEAMAADVVVVASDIEPNRDILGPEQVRRHPEEAIALLRGIVTDPALAVRLLESQHARRSRYGARRMVAEWASVYERLAGGPAAQRIRQR